MRLLDDWLASAWVGLVWFLVGLSSLLARKQGMAVGELMLFISESRELALSTKSA
jgi:hypothetical protein